MNTLMRKLEEMLEQKGWSVTALGEDSEWWVDERWQVQSSWSPAVTIHLTFLVDPQHDGPRPKGAAVWAVSVSTTPPATRAEVEQTFVLRERHLEEIVRFAGELRDAAAAVQHSASEVIER